MAKAACGMVRLRASGPDDNFSTLDLLSGLHGICQTLNNQVGVDSLDKNVTHRLSIAANVLSTMLYDRLM